MDIHNLDPIFHPKRIALIGVSSNPNSVGGKVLSNLVGGGFSGVVYPVNSDFEAVMGIQCYPNLASVPRLPDLAVICTPAEKVPNLVLECAETGIRGVVILSAGFKEAGAEGIKLEQHIADIHAKYPNMRIVGPNCLGVIVPRDKLNLSFAGAIPRTGNVAFISQSGALCTSVLDWALEGKVGFSYFVSIGNSLDVEFGDLIDYFGEDENTQSIVLYIESIQEARKFMTAARAFARSKPIIVYKAGRFPESAQVAASHTGAMAAEDDIYDAAFQRVGLARVYDIGDIFDVVALIGRNKFPEGPNLAIVTNAGGPGVMATDALIAANGVLAKLSDATMEQLNNELPPIWSHRNPVDVLGDARTKRIEKAVQIVLNDKNVNAVLVILTPQAMTNPTGTAKAIAKLADTSSKPVLAAWLGGESMREGIRILIDNGVAAYQTPEQAIRSFMTLVQYNRNLQTLYETPKDIAVEFEWDRAQKHDEFLRKNGIVDGIISEDVSKQLLETYGIPTARPIPASTAKEAVTVAGRVGYPVVLKILSPDITHKSDVGGVVLNVENQEMVISSFERMLENVRVKQPSAKIDGISVQPMIQFKDSLELIAGIKQDPVFGTILMVGMGGVTAELFADRSLAFPPLNERLARGMLESLKIFPLLIGYRGRAPIDIDKLIDVLIRLSYLAADYPEIAELDINPLLVAPNEIIALDARIVVSSSHINKSTVPYSHLALRPYPEKFVSKIVLRDGTGVFLRPIKPEDEPKWRKLLAGCSKETIYSRFRYFFHWDSHDVASRYCYIDYDRELAIVAEIEENGERMLIGIGRTISDPNHDTAEYAILITDLWQNREIGGALTDYCIEVAKLQWNVKRIYAQTTTDNRAMIAVFEKRGFAISVDESGGCVDCTKELNINKLV